MLEEGLWAEVIVGKEHLRLFSERTPSGVQASVYNVTGKTWIAPSESVEHRRGKRSCTKIRERIFAARSWL